MFSEDHIVTRLSPSYNGLTNEKDKDFRFTMRFDRNKCTKKLLDAMYAGDIGVEVMDKSLVYNVESMDWDTGVCKNWQQGRVYILLTNIVWSEFEWESSPSFQKGKFPI